MELINNNFEKREAVKLSEPIAVSEENRLENFKKWFLILVIVSVTLGAIIGGVSVYNKAINKKKNASPQAVPTPTVSTVTPTSPQPTGSSPTPSTSQSRRLSPTPSIQKTDKADLKIKILNGGGVQGEAGRASQYLEKLGYQNVKTGNADSYKYDKTIIQIKQDKKKYLDSLKEDLAKKYVLEEKEKILEEKESFDIIIILGKNFSASATPSVSP